jgi:EF hand domain-containing protein
MEPFLKRSSLGDYLMRANKTFLVSALTGVLLTSAAGVAIAQGGPGGHHGMRGPGELFDKFDLNEDGAITREEMENARAARFSQADIDGDGLISAEEMQAKMAANIEAHQKAIFERRDTNEDGFLSAEEMQGGRGGERQGRFFDRADENDDGKVTREEAEAMREKMEERRGHRRGSND